MDRVTVTLDPEYATKLARMAERMHVQPGTLARSLLSQALDEADADARSIALLLDGVPAARERVDVGLRQARDGNTVSVDEL
jgi:predicted transcriptional regulator